MLDRQLDELKLTGNLPSPSGVGLSILRLTQGDDYSIGEITKVIRTDPALTGRIVKLANGAAKTGLEAVTTADEAAMRLGVRSVRNLALGFTLVNSNRNGQCPGFDYEAYWARSLGVGICGQVLATELRLALPADAFTCGLLSNIGSLALASIHPERYTALIEQTVNGGPRRLIDLERDELDLDHRELCGAMLRDWKLPESFAYAVENYELGPIPSDAPSESAHNMTVVLNAAWRMVRIFLGSRDESAQSAKRLEEFRAELEIEPSAFESMCELALQGWEEWGATLRIPTGACFDEKEILNRAEWARSNPGAGGEDQKAPVRRGLRILAVDDDPVSLRLLEHHLIRDGHIVVKASNGQEALEMALRGDPQMVVTDWNMPEMDGLELCKALRSTPNGRAKYILLLTGREEEDRVVEAFDAGANDYVVKPFNPKILLARVRAGQRMIEMREQNELTRRARERQVAEMAVLNRKLKAAAMTDVLTRLANRRYAMRRLDQEVSKANRAKSPMSVIMIDIDHFKTVNDQCGHDMGDQVLRETASVLKSETRKGDVVCRLGGEEFLVICASSTLEMGDATAERIRSAVEENIIGHGLDRNVTVSCGVASLGPGLHTVDALLKESDRRVYVAKARGRNQVCSDDASEDERATA